MDDFDFELEAFTMETGFLTNFPSFQLEKYQTAVHYFSQIRSDIELKIDKGYNSEYGLYIISGREDLSAFWRIMDELLY